MTFAAVMEMSTVKITLALAVAWGVLAKHGKADKEEHLEIYLCAPIGIEIGEKILRSLRVQSPKNLVFRLQKTL